MSDGPHRSLKMKGPWRALAERADNPSFDQRSVDEQLSYALAAECKEVPRELLTALSRCFGGGEQGLLIPPSVESIDRLRTMSAGCPLGGLILDYAEQAAAEGRCGTSALETILSSSLEERTQRGIKQMEEHYRRESTDRRAERLYERLGHSCDGTAIRDLARQLLVNSRPVRVERPQKLRGLNEGASLR
jgi:hypothetical protein